MNKLFLDGSLGFWLVDDVMAYVQFAYHLYMNKYNTHIIYADFKWKKASTRGIKL